MAFIMEDTTTIIRDKTVAEAAMAPAKRSKGHKSCRGKGEGTLKLRGGIYHAQWTVNGKTYSRSTKTSNKREALAKLEEYIAPFRAGNEKAVLENISTRLQGIKGEIAAAEAKKPALLISAAWDAYERATNRPDSGTGTLRCYEGQFSVFEKWVASNHSEVRELRHVTQKVADEFIGYIGASRSPNTFNKYRTFFSCMWEVLRPIARLTVNPWKNIRRKIDVGHSRRELTIDELQRVVGSAKGEMRVLFAIGTYTGLRLGDCALLEWGNIDMARGIISVIPRKTARHSHGVPTVIPINPTLGNILSALPEQTGYVVPEIAALYKRRTDALTGRIQRHFQNCGIKTISEKTNGMNNRVEVGFHSLRHTFVSLSANSGVPLAFVQAIVGHSNPAMTAHYYHKDEKALKSATAAIPDVIDVEVLHDKGKEALSLPAPATSSLLYEFKALAAKMTTDERLAAIEHLKVLVV